MRLKQMMAGAGLAAMLVVQATAATAAPAASRLSVANAVPAARVGAPTSSRDSKLAGNGAGLALLALIVGGTIYGFVEVSNDDDSDSN